MFKKLSSKLYFIALLVLVVFASTTTKAHANPSYFAGVPTAAQTAAATTSPAFMTSGTGTSTISYDSYIPTTKIPTYKADSVGLAIQYTGSSTLSVLGMSVELSQDGIDWYSDSVLDQNNYSTTTSQSVSLQQTNTMSMTFASSTLAGGAVTPANSKIMTRFIVLQSPARFIRVVFSETGSNGSVWVTFIPIKEAY